jgi:hypothetical protein
MRDGMSKFGSILPAHQEKVIAEQALQQTGDF